MKMIIDCTKKCVCLLLIISVLVISFAGCSSNTAKGGNYKFYNADMMESDMLATNSEHELYWDKEAKAVLLKSKSTGKIWSNMLYDSFKNGSTVDNSNSSLFITVYNTTTLATDTVNNEYALSQGGSILCKKIDSGIRVTYFFDLYKIAIPVEYKLLDDCLEVSIDGGNILEDGSQYKLVSVKVAPYMCSAVNRDDKSGYLFVPSGTGALAYAKNSTSDVNELSFEVYGSDASRRIPQDYSKEEYCRLPVFGVKDGDAALFGIIDKGANAAFINVTTCDSRINYSNVHAEFCFRGYDVFKFINRAQGHQITERYSENIIDDTVSVKYYPLYGDKANYNEMANVYRNYLIDNEGLKKSNTDVSSYSISLYGGTVVKESKFGIPREKLVAMTDFDDALEIVKNVHSTTNIIPTVRLMNYGDNGMNPGTIGGGKSYPSLFGNKKAINKIQDYTKSNNSLMFIDSDIVRFSKSGNGFSLNSDSSFTAINHKSEQYLTTPLRLQDEESMYRILSRDSLSEAADKAIKKADKYALSALSLSTLGSIAYSDYKNEKYYVRNDIDKDVTSIFSKIKKNGLTVATSSANSYAAAVVDVVFDTALDNGLYDAFDESIPFYQMVFHSYKPMYSTAVNLASNSDEALMLAAQSGTGIDFSLIKNHVFNSNDTQLHKLYGMVYEDNASKIVTYLDKTGFNDCYNSVKNATLYKYEILDNGVTASYFENGVIIYANHTSSSVNSPIGELDGYGFKMDGGK